MTIAPSALRPPPSAFQHELSIACLAAREAGAIARQMQAGIEPVAKSDGSPVTPGDLAADAVIRHHLTMHFPGDAILSEEAADDPARLANRRVWIIDPIDGTKDYVAGGAGWAVQVALAIDGRTVLGVLDLPGYGTQLSGVPGAGATVVDADGVRPLVPLTGAGTTIIASSSPRNAASLAVIRAALPEFAFTTCTSVGVKVFHILRGEADVYVHARRINEWDAAAPAAVLAAAGGNATAFDGVELAYNTPDARCLGLLFSTRADHAQLVRRLRDAGVPLS